MMDSFEAKPLPPKPTLGEESSGKATTSLVLGILAFCIPVFAGLAAILFGILALGDISRSDGRLRGKALAIIGMVLGCAGLLFSMAVSLALLLPAVQAAREAARRAQASNNMKQIGIGLLNYHDTYNSLPPRGIEYVRPDSPADGPSPMETKAGLSWRVRILPYIEQQMLYEQFDFNQPWDHPTNMALISQMPRIYVSPNREINDGQTVYLGITYRPDLAVNALPSPQLAPFIGGTYFDDGPRFRQPGFDRSKLARIVDGTSNTIAVVEADADRAVIWTKPEDLEVDLLNPHNGLGNLRYQGFMVLMGDASVHFLPNTISNVDLLRLFCRSDAQPLNPNVFSRGSHRGY